MRNAGGCRDRKTCGFAAGGRIVLSHLILLAGMALAQAPSTALPAGDSLADKVKSLVAQLDSNDLAQREAAEQGLVAIGPNVHSRRSEESPESRPWRSR
jgi:hypothetical protein